MHDSNAVWHPRVVIGVASDRGLRHWHQKKAQYSTSESVDFALPRQRLYELWYFAHTVTNLNRLSRAKYRDPWSL